MTALPQAFLRLPIAHRALHHRTAGRIENSPAAIRAAIAAGFAIEIDLQLSADDVAMVFHDERLDRLTGHTGLLRARTAADLGRIGLTGGVDTIPTLREVLALVDGQVPLLIELKDQTDTGAAMGALEQAAATALAAYRGPVAVMSFNPMMVAEMARLAPGIPRGLTTATYDAANWPDLPAATRDRLRDIPDYGPTGSSFISHEWRDLGRGRVADLRDQGAAILCWTIRSPDEEAEARRIAHNVTFEGYLPPR